MSLYKISTNSSEENSHDKGGQKRVLAIQDISCVGRCSLTVALPILSAAGLNTSILPTAILSTHPGGFKGFTYRDLTADITPASKHWQSLGLKFDALYSGFLASYEQIDKISGLFNTFKGKETMVMVDPAMADGGVLYSVCSPRMVEGMTALCSQADIIVPNLTEAAFILDEKYVGEKYSREYIVDTLVNLSLLGSSKVVLTGVSLAKDQIGAAAYDRATGTFCYAFRNRIPGHFHGTGDVFSSTLLAALLNGFSLQNALQIAVDYTHQCIMLTVQSQLELRYGLCFERAIPYLIKRLGLDKY